MATPDENVNGTPSAKPDDFEMTLEPIDAAELNLEDVPVVEAAETPRPGFGFWKAFLWCFAFLLLTQGVPAVLVLVVLTAIRMTSVGDLTEALVLTRDDPITSKALVAIAPICGVIFSLFLFPRMVGSDWRRKLGIQMPHFEHVVMIFLLIFPFLIYNIAMEMLLVPVFSKWNIPGTDMLQQTMQAMTTWPWLLLVLAMSLGPAVSEELFCRGFLGQGLTGRYGLLAGILTTSFLFGLIHLMPLQAIAASIMGIALHLVYVATRSIFIPMLLHFLNNSLALLSVSKDLPVPVGNSLEHALVLRPILMLIAATLLAIAIGWLFYQSRVRIWTVTGACQGRALYPHVELPRDSSTDQARAGSMSPKAIGLLIVTSALFAAVWFGV